MYIIIVVLTLCGHCLIVCFLNMINILLSVVHLKEMKPLNAHILKNLDVGSR